MSQFSDKVYATSMPPSSGKSAIARNNYDGVTQHWEGRESKGDVDVAFKVQVPESRLTKEKDPDGRDIITHKGSIDFAIDP